MKLYQIIYVPNQNQRWKIKYRQLYRKQQEYQQIWHK